MSKKILAVFGCVAVGLGSTFGANIISDWTGSFSGTHQWNTAGNWTPAAVPNNGSGDTYVPRIINSTIDDLVVETPVGSAISVHPFTFSQTGNGSSVLRLGNNFTALGFTTISTVTYNTTFKNTTNDPSNLILDLNGHNFTVIGGAPSAGIRDDRNYTIRDTSTLGNGVFELSGIGNSAGNAGRVNVENNVTVKIATNAALDLRGLSSSLTEGWNFSPNATLWISGGAGGGVGSGLYFGGTMGNVIVGDTNNASRTSNVLYTSTARVLGDVTYHIAQNSTGSYLALANNTRLHVGGDFTDMSTNVLDYANQVNTRTNMVFNGGMASEKEVWIARGGLTTSFQVGENASAAGNVVLLHDLTTTANTNANSGLFTLLKESRVNVDTFRITATGVTIETGVGDVRPTVAMTFGDNSSALLEATGQLSLNSFDLELTLDGSGWTNGENLLLFKYGSLSGTPFLGDLSAPPDFTYDALQWGTIAGGNYVYLSNVSVIPEPSALILAGLGISACFHFRRRRA